MPSKIKRGKVDRGFEREGYWFIRPDDGGEDVFASHVDVCAARESNATLAVGQRVTFRISDPGIDGKVQALRIRVLGNPAATAVEPGKLEYNVWGYVKCFFPKKGFGFLTRIGKGDVFFHVSELPRTADPSDPDFVGSKFAFDIKPTKKGPEAIKIRLVK